MRDFLQQETGHLTPPHLTYFSHWLLLCCLEAATMEAKNGRKRAWLQTAEERCEDDPRNLSPLQSSFIIFIIHLIDTISLHVRTNPFLVRRTGAVWGTCGSAVQSWCSLKGFSSIGSSAAVQLHKRV